MPDNVTQLNTNPDDEPFYVTHEEDGSIVMEVRPDSSFYRSLVEQGLV